MYGHIIILKSTFAFTLCVQKADYCPGTAVSGVQSVNFSVDCIECDNGNTDAVFQFRVYSEAFSEYI